MTFLRRSIFQAGRQVNTSVTRLGNFLKFLASNFRIKVATFGYFWVITLDQVGRYTFIIWQFNCKGEKCFLEAKKKDDLNCCRISVISFNQKIGERRRRRRHLFLMFQLNQKINKWSIDVGSRFGSYQISLSPVNTQARIGQAYPPLQGQCSFIGICMLAGQLSHDSASRFVV